MMQLTIDDAAFDELLTLKPKLVAISHVTNALGTVNNVETLSTVKQNQQAQSLLIDGAQAIAHFDIDVQAD